MIFYYINIVLIMLLIVSTVGYVFVVLKEKLYLTKNIVLIEKKSVTQNHIKEVDVKEFLIGKTKLKTGDEVKIKLSSSKSFSGIIIGAKRKENSILIVTYKDRIKSLKVNTISKIKIVSKYGKFLKR